jgi:hypothetical protein
LNSSVRWLLSGSPAGSSSSAVLATSSAADRSPSVSRPRISAHCILVRPLRSSRSARTWYAAWRATTRSTIPASGSAATPVASASTAAASLFRSPVESAAACLSRRGEVGSARRTSDPDRTMYSSTGWRAASRTASAWSACRACRMPPAHAKTAASREGLARSRVASITASTQASAAVPAMSWPSSVSRSAADTPNTSLNVRVLRPIRSMATAGMPGSSSRARAAREL